MVRSDSEGLIFFQEELVKAFLRTGILKYWGFGFWGGGGGSGGGECCCVCCFGFGFFYLEGDFQHHSSFG